MSSDITTQVIQKFNELIIPSKNLKCSNELCDCSVVKIKDKNLIKCNGCGTFTCYLCNKSVSVDNIGNITNHFGKKGCKFYTLGLEDFKSFRFKSLKKIRDYFIDDTTPRAHHITYFSNKDNTDVEIFKVDGVDLVALSREIKIDSAIEMLRVNYMPDRNDPVIAEHIRNNDHIIMVIRHEGNTFVGRLFFKNIPFGDELLTLFIDSYSNKHFLLSKKCDDLKRKGDVQNCGILYHKSIKRDTLEIPFGFTYTACKQRDYYYGIVTNVQNPITSQYIKEGDELVSVNGEKFDLTNRLADVIRSSLEIKIAFIRPFVPSNTDMDDYSNLDNWRNHTNTSTITMKGTLNIPRLVADDQTHRYMYESRLQRQIPGIASSFNIRGTFQHNGKEYNDEFILSIVNRLEPENLQRLGFHVFNNVHYDFQYITANGSNEFGDYVAVGYVCNRKYTIFRNYVPKKIDLKRPLDLTNEEKKRNFSNDA